MDVDVNPYFDGDDYVTDRDSVRLTSQLDKVRAMVATRLNWNQKGYR